MFYRDIAMNNFPVNGILLYGAEEHKREVGRLPVTRSSKYPINIIVSNADNTPLVMNTYPPVLWNKHYNIGVWAWELSMFPKDWMVNLKYLDEVSNGRRPFFKTSYVILSLLLLLIGLGSVLLCANVHNFFARI